MTKLTRSRAIVLAYDETNLSPREAALSESQLETIRDENPGTVAEWCIRQLETIKDFDRLEQVAELIHELTHDMPCECSWRDVIPDYIPHARALIKLVGGVGPAIQVMDIIYGKRL